ncbi:unnamed protein product [Linum trigynum]|uniref:BHLH domain-containing protein n=1 Tax=Linum trigynum TaxID=586398 RepID=A0AAV2DBT1_9ROSI
MFPHDNGGEDDPSLIFFPPDFTTLSYPQSPPPLLPQDLITFQTAAAQTPTPFTDPAGNPNFAGAQFPDPPAGVAEDVPATSGNMRKNIIHREVERQRRKEMATLHSSLRNLLPLRFVKGKRAVSDHMQAAVEYIRELQRRTDELSKKRDALKSGYGTGTRDDQVGSSSTSNVSAVSSGIVMVRPCLIGVEVAVNVSSSSSGGGGQQGGLQLSRVVELLMGQGLDVVTCDTVRVNDRFIHTLQSKVGKKAS